MGSMGSCKRVLAVLLVVLMLTGGLPAVLASGTSDEGRSFRQGGQGWEGDHHWKMFGRDSSHSGLANSFARGLSNPGTKWERPTAAASLGTVIGNFTGNVLATNSSHTWREQLHCAVYSTANQIHVVEGSQGEDVWRLNITGTFSAAPVLHDVDLDGATDILLATRTGVLYAYEPVIRWNGTRFTWWANNTQREQLWNTTGRTIGTITASSLTLDDLSDNGSAEMVVGTSQGVFCLNARYGNELWNRTVSGVSISTPAVFKFGSQRNVVATSFNTTPAPDELHVYTLRGRTGALMKHLTMEVSISGAFVPAPPFFPSPVAADLDKEDDSDELIIIQPYVDGTGRILVFRDGDLDRGSVAFNRTLGGTGISNQLCHATPAVADLDGNGVLDVVVASWKTYALPLGTNTNTSVSVFKGISGTRGWRTYIDATGGIDLEWAMSSPVLMDADEDDVLDVVLVQYNGRMNALSGKNGTVLWDYTTRGYPASVLTSSPAVGDLDLDGFPEVVVNSQAVSFLLPDLTLSSEDITLTDPTPEEGERVGIDVSVHNEGNDDARSVVVSVWDGDVLVGNSTIGTIVAGSSYSARVQHEFYGRVDHTLRVEVDPLDAIEELREDNNVASVGVTIVSKYGLAIDCPSDIAIVSPGTTWHYFCEVANLGLYHNRIRVVATQPPSGWTVNVNPSAFTLGPAGSGSHRTTVDVEVRVDVAAVAGEVPTIVTATSQNETRNNDSVVLTTVVKGTYGVFLAPSESRRSVAPGDAVVYKFNATNIGNNVDSFNVATIVPSPDPSWGLNVFPTQINALAPEGSQEIYLSVSAPYEASEGESYVVFLNVESIGNDTFYDESKTVTTVVIPDIAVLGLRYLRADGTEVDGDTKRLVVGEESTIVARVTNLRRNTDISNLRVRFTIDGVNHDVTAQDLPATSITEVEFRHTFTGQGVHSVRVVADPFEVISDSDRGNNGATGTLQVKDRTPVGTYELGGTVHSSDGVTPVPGASVRLTVTPTAYTFTVTADMDGSYTASLADSRYSDGDEVVVNATDGRDFAEESLLVYSEDGGATVDLVLGEGVHYDVAFLVASETVEVDTGDPARVNVTLVSLGNRAATVDLSALSTGWSPALEHANGTAATVVDLPMEGTVDLVLTFAVPTDAKGGTDMTFRLLGVPREDADAAGELNVTATVRTVVGLTIGVTTTPVGPAHDGETRHYNLTVSNEGNVDDVVDLTYDDNYEAWDVTFDLASVSLPAFGQVTVKVTITVPEGTDAGEYTISVSGASRSDDTVVANAYLVETVESKRYGVTIAPIFGDTVTGKPGQTVQWELRLTNLGNVEDSFTLSIFGQGVGFVHRFEMDQAAVTEIPLAAGASDTLILEMDIPSEFTSTPLTSMPITVKASSRSHTTAFNNTVVTLTLSGILDLTMDVTVSTNSPVVGERVRFTVEVRNLGPDDAEGVWVFAWFGEEKVKKSVGDVAADGTKEVVIEWFPEKEGAIQVKIVLNPEGEDSTLFETSREGDEWVKPFRVGSAEKEGILGNYLVWLALIIIVVVGIAAWSMYGRREDEDYAEEVEVVEDEDLDEDGLEDEDEDELEDDGEDLDQDGEPEPAPEPRPRPKKRRAAPTKKRPPREPAAGAEEPEIPNLGGGRI